jgi:hypothetical protein
VEDGKITTEALPVQLQLFAEPHLQLPMTPAGLQQRSTFELEKYSTVVTTSMLRTELYTTIISLAIRMRRCSQDDSPFANNGLRQQTFLLVASGLGSCMAKRRLYHGRAGYFASGRLHRNHSLSSIQPKYSLAGTLVLAGWHVEDFSAIFSIQRRHAGNHLTSARTKGRLVLTRIAAAKLRRVMNGEAD